MISFNIDIWQKIKAEFEDLENKVYFGEVPEEIEAPFCVMHVLDNGVDDTFSTICDDNKIYKADIQFSLYDYNDMAIDELLINLNSFISQLKDLEKYRILSKQRVRTRNSNGFSAEVGMGYTEYIFTYEIL